MSQLTNYIQKELDKGFSKDLISKKLLQAGYSQQEISESFQSLKSAEPLLRRKSIEMPHMEFHLKWSRWVFGILAVLLVLVFGYLIYLYEGDMESIGEKGSLIISEGIEEEIFSCGFAEDRRFCITQLALQQDNITVCEKGTYCTAAFAVAKNDATLCLELEESKKDQCILLFYDSTGDATYCSKQDLYCGYNPNASADEIRAYLTEKLENVELGATAENILQFAVEKEQPIACEFWNPLSQEYTSLFNTYGLDAYDFCLFAIVYETQNTTFCITIAESNKKTTCLEILGCDTTSEEICNALD